MENTSILQTGSFTADGTTQIINFRGKIDWIELWNHTYADSASAQDKGYRFYWQTGMGTDGLVEYHTGSNQEQSINGTGTGAFTVFDASTYAGGSLVSVTTATNPGGGQPVYTVSATTGINANSIVRLKNVVEDTGSLKSPLNGLDFSVDDIDNGGTNFRLKNALMGAPGGDATTGGQYKLVAPSLATYKLFKPRTRVIGKIDVSAPTAPVVSTLVDHGFAVGDAVKFSITNSNYGMTQINGLTGTVTNADNAGYFTCDIDTTGFTAFAWETVFTLSNPYPTVTPVGAAGGTAYEELGTPSFNQGYTGMVLAGGALLPGGDANTMYWKAGTSWSSM